MMKMRRRKQHDQRIKVPRRPIRPMTDEPRGSDGRKDLRNGKTDIWMASKAN